MSLLVVLEYGIETYGSIPQWTSVSKSKHRADRQRRLRRYLALEVRQVPTRPEPRDFWQDFAHSGVDPSATDS
jgi:hypothetical protein